ncbi:hypothetical protein Kpho02_60500 [Kitasatospora phosalacinea]|uniref:Uncharacterized protein n=1 Tax=Kitasatospora phosalacinea TaxID=2065 RepID=A0A9W6QFW7_9ACTN|nr:hypothetical protein [Kitasatospora phosalacinea]GLW73752.1 hypothetical protein Kpho02_60500 [Kitasatospora phosalacinea]
MKPSIKKAMAAAAARLVSESTNSITTPAHTASYTAAALAVPALPGPDGGTGRGHRPLTGTEAVVVIIIILTAAGLALAGLPIFGVLELLGGSGIVAVGVLTRRAPRLPALQSA